MDIQRIPISKIDPAPYNPRIDLTPEDPRYKRLVSSLDSFGLVEPLVWNRRNGTLVSGHQRLKVLVARGETEAPVSVVDLDPQKEKALNLALNKVGGGWDEEKLADVLRDLLDGDGEQDWAFDATGFGLDETEALLAGLEPPSDESEAFDLGAELAEHRPPITRPGELIALGALGEHRLLCGDSTDPAVIERLLGEHRASLCLTDPPYGARYEPTKRRGGGDPAGPGERFSALRNDDLTPKRYAAWFEGVVGAIDAALRPGSGFYVWNGHHQFGLMHDRLITKGFHISAVITWAKESFAPGRGDFQEQTELCLYGWKSGARHRFYGPRNASTLWSVRRDSTRLYHHPTQKALELAERAIRYSSKRGEIVFDPFLGGGTSLIASARLGRRCFGVEIEPRFCDAVVRRYIALAGRSVVSPEIAERYATDAVKEAAA